MRNHGHVRLEDFDSLFEALQMGDGPEDISDDEDVDEVVTFDDKTSVSGGGKKSVSSDSEEEVDKEEEEEDSWAYIPERVDLATCKALLAKHYPGEEVGNIYKTNASNHRRLRVREELGLELGLN